MRTSTFSHWNLARELISEEALIVNNRWQFPATVIECKDCIHTLNMTVYVMTDIYDNRIIGIWTSEEKARKWLYAQVDSGAWTKGEAASVSIEAMRVF